MAESSEETKYRYVKFIIKLAVVAVIAGGVIIWSVYYQPDRFEGQQQAKEEKGEAKEKVDKPAVATGAEKAEEPNIADEAKEPQGPNEADEAKESREPNEPMEALNLKNVEMKDIISKLADWTGKVIIPSEEVMKQKLTIYSAKEIRRSRALGLLYSALRAKGFVAEESDGVIYLKPIAEAITGSVPTVAADYPLAMLENKQQVVQKFFRLANYSPSQMGDILLPLVGDYGYVSAEESTRMLLVIDTVENLMRFERIIGQFDVPESEQMVEEVFEIKRGDPAEIVQVLRLLLGEESDDRRRSRGRGGRPPGRRGGSTRSGDSDEAATSVVVEAGDVPVILIPEPRRKWIIARASSQDMQRIRVWIKRLDEQSKAESESETIAITYADVGEVADQLNEALQRPELKANVFIQPLRQARQIMVFGRKDLRNMVKKLVAEIDVPSGDFETKTFELKHVDAEQIKENLDNLYGESRPSGRNAYYYYRYGRGRQNLADVVKTIAFPAMQQVTVIASVEKMREIEEHIAEWDTPIDVEEVKPRIIALHNTDPVEMADLLSTLFTEEVAEQRSFWYYFYRGAETKEKIVGPLYGQLTFEPVPGAKKIIVISKIPEAYEVIENLIRELDKQEMAEVPRVVTLNYADPEELSERLNAIFNEPGTEATIRLGERGLSSYSMEEGDNKDDNSDNRGTSSSVYKPWWTGERRRLGEMPISNVIGRVRFIPDRRSKAILVLAPPEFQDSIKQMITELDTPGRQVMIKAIIVEVDHSNLTSLGLQLSSNSSAFGTLDEDAITALGELTLLESRGSVTLSADTDVTALIDFLHKRTDAKILNQQTLWTQDNEEAEFFKGDKVAFTTDTSISETGGRVTSEFEFERVGMTLRTRPSITPEKKVDMIINVELSQLSGELVNAQPVRTEMETTTNMIVEDGATIMLGGMLLQEDSTVERKIPLFGDLPLLGGLFRHNAITEVNTEMLVFITPYVLDEPDSILSETREEIERPLERLDKIREDLKPLEKLGEEGESNSPNESGD